MRRIIAALAILLLVSQAGAYDLTLPAGTPTEVYYSPRGGAQAALVRHIDAARQSIYVLAYSFTSEPIAEALVRAAQRGVHVEVILDKSHRRARWSRGRELARAGIDVYIDRRHAIAHNKVMIFDGAVVATGSFNFTASAEQRNAENLLVLASPALTKLYREEWSRHRAHAERW